MTSLDAPNILFPASKGTWHMWTVTGDFKEYKDLVISGNGPHVPGSF
jgi:hypothetical protein